MAASSCCWMTLPSKMRTLSLSSSSSSCASMTNLGTSLSFSSNLPSISISQGYLKLSSGQGRTRQLVVCEAAPQRKADSAAKRARQAEKRRIYNKARKSEIKTRIKKVLEALDELKKKPDAQAEEILPVEKLIGEAYSVIDKAVKVGTLHRNTGARRKSRLARRKKAVEIHRGWYSPAPETVTA